MSTKQKVFFPNKTLKMAGEIYFPEGLDTEKKYPSIVVTHPGNGVKEQVAGLYARLLSEKGFITLASMPLIRERVKDYRAIWKILPQEWRISVAR